MPADRPRPRPARNRTAPSVPPPAGAGTAAYSFGVFAGALALYAAMAPHVCGNKDASEFTLVLATLGVAHPTGYPLYTFAGYAFAHALHALGVSWPWAANLFSALGGACAVALLHRFAGRLLARAGIVAPAAALWALIPAAAFGLNPSWTIEAAVAEVNSWHVAWTAWAAVFFLGAIEAFDRRDDERDGVRALAFGLLAGVGLAHHRTSILTIAPFAVALVAAAMRARRLRARLVPWALAGVVLPVLSYGFVFWRAFHPVVGQWSVLGPSAGSAIDHIMGSQYEGYLGHFAPMGVQRRIVAVELLPWLVPTLAIVLAWAALGRRDPWPLRLGIAGAVCVNAAFALSYGVSDPSSYFLAPLALAVAVVPAAVAIAPLRRPLAVIGLALTALQAIPWLGTGLARPAAFRGFDAQLRTLWVSIPHDSGFVVWDNDMSERLRVYQLLDHEKPALEVVNPPILTHTWPRRRFEERHGFDPVEGLERLAGQGTVRPFEEAVADRINRNSPQPVVIYRPEEGSANTLVKPPRDSARTSPARLPGVRGVP